ncbi:MAG: hypothetical protein AB2693_31765, partial [Candidatus Thiodiazotropha sp.]
FGPIFFFFFFFFAILESLRLLTCCAGCCDNTNQEPIIDLVLLTEVDQPATRGVLLSQFLLGRKAFSDG